MDVLADRVALGHRGDHGVAEVLRVRAREADPLDALDGVAGAQQLAELGVDAGAQVAAPRVDVLAEQRDLLDAVGGEAGHLGDDLPGPAALLAAPDRRDDAVRALGVAAHRHLHPGAERALAVHRQVAGEVLVRAEPAARRLSAGADPLAEVRDRARPERDVDLRVELEDPLLLRLGVAAADGDTRSGSWRLRAPASPRYAASFVSGFSRIVQVLKTSTSASSCEGASPSPSDSSMPLIRSES